MKTFTIIILAWIGPALVSTAASAQSFVLNGVTHCQSSPANWISFNLDAGVHQIEYMGGAWSPWSFDGANGGQSWVGKVFVYVEVGSVPRILDMTRLWS